MKKFNKILVLFALVAAMVCCFAGCNQPKLDITPVQIQVGNEKPVLFKTDDTAGMEFETIKLEYTGKNNKEFKNEYKAIKLLDVLKAKGINAKVNNIELIAKDKNNLSLPPVTNDRFDFSTKDVNKLYVGFKINTDGKFEVGKGPFLFQDKETSANQICSYLVKIVINPVEVNIQSK